MWRLLALLLPLVSASPDPAPPLSQTPEGRRFLAFVEAVNAGTTDAWTAFAESSFSPAARRKTPVAERVERLSRMSAELAPLEIVRASATPGGGVTALVRSRKNGESLRLSLEFEPGPERFLSGIRAEAGHGESPDETTEPSGPDDAPKGSDAETAAAADAWVSSLAAKDEFSGVVLLTRKGTPIFEKAWGMADRGLQVPNRTTTRFNIGSITKTFTKSAIARLAREGKLTLDDTVSRHLPELPIPAADRITIRQLLEMTSGLGDVFGERFDATPKERLRALSDYVPLFSGGPLLFEPGKGRKYSNAGYVVLGLIVEKHAGRPFHDYLREAVYEPAGMRSSGAFAVDEIVPDRAIGYTREKDGPLRANTYALPARGSSAGGTYSTAGDLARFAAALAENRLPMPDGGLGEGGKLGIAGGTQGANAILDVDAESGLVMVVLANDDPPAAQRVVRRLRKWLGVS